MSLDGTYDDGNIFAKILRGEMPAARVFEDEHVFAFMDVFPQARGHTLVIPKHSGARNLLEEHARILQRFRSAGGQAGVAREGGPPRHDMAARETRPPAREAPGPGAPRLPFAPRTSRLASNKLA